MRSLNRNKRSIYYALYIEDENILDEYGNETGEVKPIYSASKELLCNISATTGEDSVQPFGSFTNYSRVICVADINCPITEKSIVWFGVSPEKPYNYIVTRKADSKNGILYALKEVTVT